MLRHGNVVAVEHFGMEADSLFMVMEWVHGVDACALLQRLHDRGQTLPIDAALFIVSEILAGLEYAHAKRDDQGRWLEIVHRDVTPHNVMVSFEGGVKLADFGIAKATSRLHQTQAGAIKGKVPYMAPEQARGLALDRRTDLFAVGVTAYELLAGRRPYVGASETECVFAMLSESRPKLRVLRSEVSAGVEAFVDKLLASAPEARFQDAGEALIALERECRPDSGQRTLKLLLRELYADEDFSTLSPRFANAASAAIEPQHALDATVPASAPFPHPAAGPHAAPPMSDDAPTTVRAAPFVAPPRGIAPPTREHRPVDLTPGPIAVVRVPHEAAALAKANSPRRTLSTATIVGVTLALGLGAGSLATRAVSSDVRAASATAASAAPPLRAEIRVATRPESTLAPDGGANEAHALAETIAPTQATPELATLSAVAEPWGFLRLDGGHTTETRATWRVPPGHHRVSATRMDVTITREVTLAPGTRQSVRIVFPMNRSPTP